MTKQADPENDRVLDGGRLTPTTTWLDAEPIGIATIPEDSLAPLVLAIVMFVFFVALVFQMLWVALARFDRDFLTGCYWMWPRHEQGDRVSTTVAEVSTRPPVRYAR